MNTKPQASMNLFERVVRRPLPVSRRSVLQGGLAGAGLAGLAAQASAGVQSTQMPNLRRRSPQPRDDELFLVNRITQGFTETAYAQARSMGYQDYLEYQLDHESIQEPQQLLDFLALFPSLEMTAREIIDSYSKTPSLPVAEARIGTLLRAWLSERQLFEVAEEFFRNVFNIYILKDSMWILFSPDHREVVRAHALGTFPDMLRASSKSAAMMFYLDNFLSYVGNINENYGREVMELHSLGVQGPYNEMDVVELARCLTGWTLELNNAETLGDFVYIDGFHDQGEKMVLGNVIPPNGGITDGETMIDILAMHPSTAEYISRRLTEWVLAYEAPQGLVDAVAQTYLGTGGDIKEMLRVIFRRGSIDLIQPWDNPKLRRPYHFGVSLMRATTPAITNVGILDEMQKLGQSPYYWAGPDGFPDSIAAWGDNVLGRWELASKFFDNQVPGLTLSDARIDAIFSDGGGPSLPDSQLAQRASEVLTGGVMPANEVDRIQQYADSRPVDTALKREVLALAASMSSYQWY